MKLEYFLKIHYLGVFFFKKKADDSVYFFNHKPSVIIYKGYYDPLDAIM